VRLGAVFDMDGTLVRGTSVERLLLRYLIRARVVGTRQVVAAAVLAAGWPFLGYTRALRRNKRWLAGVPTEAVRSRMDAFLDQAVAPRWCGPLMDRMEALRSDGVALFLLSGAPDFLVAAVAERLEVAGWVGTEMEVVDGRFTGRLAGTHRFGSAKREALHALARECGLDLERSWGFADHETDVAFLESFGRPVAVDPDAGLRRVAEARGWPVVACGGGP
jgi:HAD superfamily hydrolase (TIGR01490 family)